MHPQIDFEPIHTMNHQHNYTRSPRQHHRRITHFSIDAMFYLIKNSWNYMRLRGRMVDGSTVIDHDIGEVKKSAYPSYKT